MIVGICTWYFTSTHDTRGNFSLSRGLWWSIRYNLGSLAFGAFILAVIWSIRVIFEYVQSKIEKLTQNNQLVKCIACIIRCCLDCCNRFVKFLNSNAYIQVALTGKNFCSSAMAAFVLALKNSGSFVITNGIGALIGFLGKITITAGNVFIGYLMLTNISGLKDEL
jgi:choline transporter-like protein 2/4/5